jgi:hypothetical protein
VGLRRERDREKGDARPPARQILPQVPLGDFCAASAAPPQIRRARRNSRRLLSLPERLFAVSCDRTQNAALLQKSRMKCVVSSVSSAAGGPNQIVLNQSATLRFF